MKQSAYSWTTFVGVIRSFHENTFCRSWRGRKFTCLHQKNNMQGILAPNMMYLFSQRVRKGYNIWGSVWHMMSVRQKWWVWDGITSAFTTKLQKEIRELWHPATNASVHLCCRKSCSALLAFTFTFVQQTMGQETDTKPTRNHHFSKHFDEI